MPYAYDDPCIHEQCLDTLAGWRGRVASAASQSERIPAANIKSAVSRAEHGRRWYGTFIRGF